MQRDGFWLFFRGKTERVGVVQLEEQKAPRRPYCSLSALKGSL